MLTGTLPAHSHRPSTNRIDRARRSQGCVPMRTARFWTVVATRWLTSAARRLRVLQRRGDRVEVPEVLDLQRRRVALDLAGHLVEVEVGLGRLRTAAVRGEQALLAGLLVVGQQLLLQLRREILE